MPLRFGNVQLQGPFSRLNELEDQPGLFVVLCYDTTRLVPFVPLDVRIAKLVQTEVESALADPKWTEMCTGKLRLAVFYSPEQTQLDSIKHQVLRSEVSLTE